VKLMPEYLCELPLWGRSWESLKLPAPLLNRSADWQDCFDDNFDAFSGWRTAQARPCGRPSQMNSSETYGKP
jgi:hypothetical protein